VTTAGYTSEQNPEADPELTDACAAPNSSGPNNAGNDNCLWTIDPGTSFDRLTFTTTIGTVSLEGGADFGNDPGHDTLFYLANAAPDAVDDTITTLEDTPVAANVLGNDTDADGDTLTITGVTQGTHGAVVNNGSDVTYTPAANYFGSDSFTYTVSDGNGGTDTATVSVTVTSVNDAPIGVVGSASTDEDTTATITVATDVESQSLTADCESTEGGTWIDNGDGTVDYTPPANFNGTDVLTCTVTDDEGASTATQAEITVTVGPVNDPPVANDDEAYTDGTTPVTIDVLANDTDLDNDALTVSAVDDSGSLGSVANNGNDVTYTPPEGFTGSDTFTYTVSDGNGGTDVGTVTVYELFECGETLTVSEGGTSAEYTRLPEQDGCDDGKPYTVDIITTDDGTTAPTEQLPTVVFQPRSQTGEPVENCAATPSLCLDEFAAEIMFGPRDEANAPDTGTLHYDPVNRAPEDYNTSTTFRTMQWCEIPDFDPFAAGRPASDLILPAGESWCIASVTTSSSSTDETLTTWTLYGIGDPAKRL
jgi:hypothetical protein